MRHFFFCCGYISLNRGFSWLRNLNSKYSSTNDERYRLLLHFLFCFFFAIQTWEWQRFLFDFFFFVKLVSQPKRFSSFSFQFHVPSSAFPFCFYSIVEKMIFFFGFFVPLQTEVCVVDFLQECVTLFWMTTNFQTILFLLNSALKNHLSK